MLWGLKVSRDESVLENNVCGTELNILVDKNLGFQNPLKILAVHQVKICGGKIFICKNFKKKKLGVRH